MVEGTAPKPATRKHIFAPRRISKVRRKLQFARRATSLASRRSVGSPPSAPAVGCDNEFGRR